MTIPAGEISVVGMSGWLLLRAVLSLGVVLALAVVLLRFVLPRLTLSGTRGKRIEVLETVAIDPKNKLVLVRAFDRELLVGVGVGGIQPLGGCPPASDSLEQGCEAEEPGPVAERPALVRRAQ